MGDNTTHALLSPSARHRWGACPGSVREEAKYPEQPGGAAANDGTRTHSLLERAIEFEFVRKEGVCGPAPYFGEVITDEYGTYTVDMERAGRINTAMEYIRSRVTDHDPIPERRVHPDGLVMRADMSGTVDVQIPGKNIYEIIDFKDGMHPVSAKDNPQLEQYALGVLAELPAESYPKTIRMTIIQPKLALRGMEPITSHDIKTSDLLERVPVIIAQAAATEDPNAPLIPGESQCKYCRAKGACPAIAGKVMQEVGMMFSPVPNVPGVFQADVPTRNPELLTLPPLSPDARAVLDGTWEPAHQAANQDPTVMSDDQLRQIAEAAPLMKQLIEGVNAEIQRRLESGKAVPGFKLVNGRGTRKWALPEEEMVKKLTGMGVPKSACYVTTLVSPAQAEKLVFEKKGEKVQLSKAQIERMNKEYVSTVMGKPSVAPESDPRPAVILDAAPMFSAVESTRNPEVLTIPPEAPAPVAETSLPPWLAVPAWLQ